MKIQLDSIMEEDRLRGKIHFDKGNQWDWDKEYSRIEHQARLCI